MQILGMSTNWAHREQVDRTPSRVDFGCQSVVLREHAAEEILVEFVPVSSRSAVEVPSISTGAMYRSLSGSSMTTLVPATSLFWFVNRAEFEVKSNRTIKRLRTSVPRIPSIARPAARKLARSIDSISTGWRWIDPTRKLSVLHTQQSAALTLPVYIEAP